MESPSQGESAQSHDPTKPQSTAGRKQSDIKQHFTKVKDTFDPASKRWDQTCNYCETTIDAKNSKNEKLLDHLLNQCPNLCADVRSAITADISSSSSSSRALLPGSSCRRGRRRGRSSSRGLQASRACSRSRQRCGRSRGWMLSSS